MDQTAFIQEFQNASAELDMDYMDQIISDCLDRCHKKSPKYPKGHTNLISAIEECAEFTEALSHRICSRTSENWNIIEEMADIILSILCVAKIYKIPYEDIKKALNVKLNREAARIAEHHTTK